MKRKNNANQTSNEAEKPRLRLANLRTVKQLAQECPYSENGLRWLVFNAESTGFARAVIRTNGRVFIDLEAFEGWLEDQRLAS